MKGCLLGLLVCLCVLIHNCVADEEIWQMLRVALSGAHADVHRSFKELQENAEQKQMLEDLLTHHLNVAGMSPREALEFVTQPPPENLNQAHKRREVHAKRDAGPNHGLLRYQGGMIAPVFGLLANNSLPMSSDACGDRTASQWYTKMDNARTLTLGLQTTAMVLRCVCKVGPKCIVIIPVLIEIPLFFWCIPYIPLIVAADRMDYQYQHARFCADVLLQRINDKINIHTQEINGIMAELSRYVLEEQIYLGIANPQVVELAVNGGRAEYALQLVKDTLYRRELTIMISGPTYSKQILTDAENSLLFAANSTDPDDQDDYLAEAFRGMNTAYLQSLSATDDPELYDND